jgi:hypothetical protein
MNLSTLLRVALPFVRSAAVATASDKAPSTYQNGSVQGWDIRVDTGDSGNGSMTRCHAKVYELSGSGLVYKIDYCGAFQAGTFGIGQAVEYHVEVSVSTFATMATKNTNVRSRAPKPQALLQRLLSPT